MAQQQDILIPLDNASSNYREWLVIVEGQQYCIVQEDETWTLLTYAPDIATWMDVEEDVAAFLERIHARLEEGDAYA